MPSKERHINLDASCYLNSSFIRSLIFEHPEALIDELKRTKNPLKSVLSAFELIAKRILGQKPKSESKKFAAEQVLIQAEKIRKAEDPETAAIAMMILSFSIAHAEASEMLLDGVRLVAGRANKKRFKGLLGVLGAINHFLDEDKTLTAKQLWNWRFKKHLNENDPNFDIGLRLRDVDTGSTYEIYYNEKKDKIFQCEKLPGKSIKTTTRSIGWESFRKEYVPKAKKLRN
jgi:hypothetical protein